MEISPAIKNIRPSEGNRAFRRHAAHVTGMRAPKGRQDDPKAVKKFVYTEAVVHCSNEGCTKSRRPGSAYCGTCR